MKCLQEAKQDGKPACNMWGHFGTVRLKVAESYNGIYAQFIWLVANVYLRFILPSIFPGCLKSQIPAYFSNDHLLKGSFNRDIHVLSFCRRHFEGLDPEGGQRTVCGQRGRNRGGAEVAEHISRDKFQRRKLLEGEPTQTSIQHSLRHDFPHSSLQRISMQGRNAIACRFFNFRIFDYFVFHLLSSALSVFDLYS